MVNFALTHGMKNNDLVRELKGNVSGESSDGSNHQELIYLYNGPIWYGDDDGTMQSHIFQHLQGYKENTPCTNAANYVKNWEYNWLSNKCIIHEVIAVDRATEYAIIQLNSYKIRLCDVCLLDQFSLPCQNPREIDCHISSYFLCGINNDDKLYFLHPLSNIPKNLITRAKDHGDVISIVKWCNKE